MPQICIYLLGLCEKKWDKNYSQIMSPLSPLRVKVGGSCPPRSYGGAAHACIQATTGWKYEKGVCQRSRLMDWMVDVTVTHMSKPTCVRQRPDRVVALRLVSVSKGRLQLFSAAHNLSLSCCVARMRCKSARYWLTAAPIATPHRQQMDVASAICFVSDVCRR